MPTLTTKTSAKKKAPRRAFAATTFPGLVRDPITGLLITPLKPGGKPVSISSIKQALSNSL